LKHLSGCRDITVLSYGGGDTGQLCSVLAAEYPGARVRFLFVTHNAGDGASETGVIAYSALSLAKIRELSGDGTDLLVFLHDDNYIKSFIRVVLLAVFFKARGKVRYKGGFRRFYSPDFLAGFSAKAWGMIPFGLVVTYLIVTLLGLVMLAKFSYVTLLMPFRRYCFKDVFRDQKEFITKAVRHVARSPFTRAEPFSYRLLLDLLVVREFLFGVSLGMGEKERTPRRIAFIRLDHLGDVINSTGALASLKARYPEAEITFFVGPWGRDLVSGCPYAEVRVFETNNTTFNRGKKIDGYVPKLIRQYLWMKRQRFDLAIDPAGWPETYRLMYLTGAARKLANDYGRWDFHYGVTLNGGLDGKAEAERVSGLLSLMDPALSYRENELWISPAEKEDAKVYLKTAGYKDGDFLLAVHPGAKWPPRRWDVQRFIELSKRVKDRVGPGFRVIVFADKDETELADAFMCSEMGPFVITAAGLKIRAMMALLSCAELFFANDSGPMHMAVSFGVPTVAVFGPGEVSRWAPADRAKHLVARKAVHCSPCPQIHCDDNICMTGLTVDNVWEGLLPSLERLIGGQ